MNEPPPVILVVDDNEDNRYLLTHRLRRLGYETVLTAEDGVEAIAMVSTRPVDLMLLDVIMPGMNGHQVLQQLKACPASREIRVIMISAVDETESVVRGIELGADDHLPKPFDPQPARVGACLRRNVCDQRPIYREETSARGAAPTNCYKPSCRRAPWPQKATNEVKPRRLGTSHNVPADNVDPTCTAIAIRRNRSCPSSALLSTRSKTSLMRVPWKR
jgi:CheY-like chemotaxis protein